MYICKYNYGCYQLDDIGAWIKSLYENSCNYYEKTTPADASVAKRFFDEAKINNIISYVEDYVRGLVELGYLNARNCRNVIKRLKKLEVIGLIENPSDSIMGTIDNNKIFINFNVSSSNNLSQYERCRLYICKNLTKFIYSDWQSQIEEYFTKLELDGNLELLVGGNRNNIIFARKGFNLLEEAMSQDVAENIAYYIAKKQRPPRSVNSDISLFNGLLYKSNFDNFSGIEDSAVKFGRTLGFINPKIYDTDEAILNKLSIMGFDKRFICSVVEGYNKDIYQQKDLFDMLLCMGKIMDAWCSKDRGEYGNESTYYSPCYLMGLGQISDKYKVYPDSKQKIKNM